MDYKSGNFVLLHDGRSVYISSIDENAKEYIVTDDSNDTFTATDDDIYMLVVGE